MRFRRRRRRLPLGAVVLAAAACGGAASVPSSDGPAGSQPVDDASSSIDASADISTEESSAPPTLGRALGTVTNVADVACDATAPASATCKQLVVQCPGLPNIGATIAVVTPPVAAGAPSATLIGFSGGGGDSFYGTGVQQLIAKNKYRIILPKWDSDWELTPADGILAAACRPSTVVQWIFEDAALHASSRANAFCATGFSGGSGQLSYALAHYGRGEVLDFVALAAGPPFGRIDYGCAPATYSGPPRALCPLLPNAVLPLPPAWLNAWENTSTCGAPSPDAAEIEKWKKDSVVSNGAFLDYPKSVVEFFICTNNPNGTTGGAYFYSQAITSTKAVFCFDGLNDNCQGEGLGKGTNTLVAEIDAKCVPRH